MKKLREILNENKIYKQQDGESEILHHVTPHDFSNFAPFSHFGTKKTARSLYMVRREKPYKKKNWLGREKEITPDPNKFNHYSVRLKLGSPSQIVHVDDFQGNHSPEEIADSLLRHKHIQRKTHSRWHEDFKKLKTDEDKYKYLSKDIREYTGIKTIAYRNDLEGTGTTSYIITHPDQVRVLRKKKNVYVNLQRGDAQRKKDVNYIMKNDI